ncbi:hypothetical protein ACFSTC_52510 [Nonomuraea ferruginea]
MQFINLVFNLLFSVLSLIVLGMSGYALVHALRVPRPTRSSRRASCRRTSG